MVDMIELSIVMNDMMNYTMMIPREITSSNFSEIIKRLKAVKGMLPKEALLETKGPRENPLLHLDLEENKELCQLYKDSTADSFAEYLKEKYNIDKNRDQIVGMIGKVKRKIEYLEKKKEKQNNV